MWLLWVAISLYVGLRLWALVSAPALENADSPYYLMLASLILSGDLGGIRAVGPDHTPFYPVAIALVGLTGIGVESAARVASFAFSILLLVAIIGIGRRMITPLGVALGVLLLAVNPQLVPLSVSVLAEPAYIGTVYLGMWLFWRQLRGFHTGWAVALGVVFALSFLNRIEGLFFLAAIPAFRIAAEVAHRGRDAFSSVPLARWSAAFVLAFVVVSAPQVWWVSDRMGGFAINGRQAWSLLSTQEEDAGRQEARERVFRLDYSPAELNVHYAQRHPEVRAALQEGTSSARRARLAVRNVDRFYWRLLGELVGPGVVAFFLVGLVGVWRRERGLHVVLVGGFLALVLSVPLWYAGAWLSMRHLTMAAPILLLVAGEGIACVASLLTTAHRRSVTHAVSLVLAGAVVATCALPLRSAIGRSSNSEYDPASLQDPAEVIREMREELHRAPVLATRRVYVAQMAGLTRAILLPHTDMEGLMTYLHLNRADLLFLEYGQLPPPRFDFMWEFLEGSLPNHLTLVYAGEAPDGSRLELYRIAAATGG